MRHLGWQDRLEICTLTFELSRVGSNVDPAINSHLGASHDSDIQGGASVCVSSTGRMISQSTCLPPLDVELVGGRQVLRS